MIRQPLIPQSMLAFVLLLGSAPTLVQAQTGVGDWEVRVYRVADLVVPRPDYPYRGDEIPTTGSSLDTKSPIVSGGLGGGGGFGGGGFGGGGSSGGGFFQVSDSSLGGGGFGTGGNFMASPEGSGSTSTGFTMTDLITAIQSTIQPESWDLQGGEGVCTPLGGMLVVKQTPAAHDEIEDLLIAIRGEGGAARTVSVHARWVMADADEIEVLVSSATDEAPAPIVDRDALAHLMATAMSYEGRITCYSGQTVHFASGERRSMISSAVPIVSATTVGYQPVITIPNIGVLLEVKPTLIADQGEAVVNLMSTVTSMPDSPETIPLSFPTSGAEGLGSVTAVQLDRLNLNTQQLATTVRVPLGQPVLVGGMSQSDAEGGSQLSLFLEVTAHSAQ